ncbi:hypothetical protein ACLI1A_10185 [Flavobacterium sp. RHBU_3]|uniref:hypothetical protein n=1 Tax=Flavobacterium sp. RHBU_3 TaxID=3391184 RepID=UPI0039851F63
MDKIEVIKWLANLPESPIEQFNEGRQIYGRSKSKNTNTERVFNLQGYKRDHLATLLYEIKKAYGVAEKEIVQYKIEAAAPVVELVEPSLIEKLAAAIRESGNGDIFLAIKIGKEYGINLLTNEYYSPELQEFINRISTSISDMKENINTLVGNEEVNFGEEEFEILCKLLENDIAAAVIPEEIKTELDHLASTGKPTEQETENNNTPTADQPTTQPEGASDIQPTATKETPAAKEAAAVGEEFSIRTKYPFLNAPDCPDEFLVLVGKKIAAWHRYAEAHGKLQQHSEGKLELTEQESKALAAQATADFEFNQAIDKELDYYQEKGEILGGLPFFRELAMKREVEAMTNEEAHNFIKNSAPYISRKKSSIKAAKSDDKKEQLQEELDERLAKVELAKAKLGINGK